MFFKFFLAGTLLFSISACAPSISRNNAVNLTIGILNQFPDSVNYIKQRTFVFRHQVADYNTDRFKQFITHSAEDYLISKGYKIIEVEDKSALTDGRADMIVQILPILGL